jgi:ABC-type nickel/cobalt efflux system permease component RcnA
LSLHAQESEKPHVKIERRQLLVPRKGEIIEPVSFQEDPAQWLQDKQRSLYGAMSGSLRNIRSGSRSNAVWGLLLLSFGYGVFHAAGPGHGKIIISSWLLATESDLRRGILIAFLSSIIQAISGIAIVSAVLFVIGGAISRARQAALAIETISFALIAMLGLYLMWTALKPLLRLSHTTHAHAGHHHDHSNELDCSCGHTHAPEPAMVHADWSLPKAVSLSLAIGVRPCTGGLLVLLAAYPMGLYWAGILSVFVMAAGTFLAVSSIAAATVYFKRFATGAVNANSRLGYWLGFGLRFGGGLLITLLGAVLFLGSLSGGVPTAA